MSFRDVGKQFLDTLKDLGIADSLGLRAKPKEIVPMKIPNGIPGDFNRTALDKKNEPSVEVLNDFSF
jgi:hypothetical protein